MEIKTEVRMTIYHQLLNKKNSPWCLLSLLIITTFKQSTIINPVLLQATYTLLYWTWCSLTRLTAPIYYSFLIFLIFFRTLFLSNHSKKKTTGNFLSNKIKTQRTKTKMFNHKLNCTPNQQIVSKTLAKIIIKILAFN